MSARTKDVTCSIPISIREVERYFRLGTNAKCRDVRYTAAFGAKDGVIGRTSLWIAEDLWVLRFRLMVKRGPLV
jgi:hypothetical protein